MADDRQEPRDPAQRGSGPDRDEGLDQTQGFDPFRDEDAEPDGAPSGHERPAGASGRDNPDETLPLPPGDETARLARGDETARLPRGDETARLPGRDATSRLPSTPGSWSGRAEVPPRGGDPVRAPAPAEWEPGDDQGGRRWWLPILLGLIALLLLGVLAFGVWLILQSRDGGAGPVLPSPSPSATAATTSPPAQPTTAAPTTAGATPSPTTAAPVQVPAVLGLPEADARSALDNVGLVYRLQYRASEQPSGTIIATDPPPGAAVRPGTLVTLVIAVPPAAPTTPASTSPGPTATR